MPCDLDAIRERHALGQATDADVGALLEEVDRRQASLDEALRVFTDPARLAQQLEYRLERDPARYHDALVQLDVLRSELANISATPTQGPNDGLAALIATGQRVAAMVDALPVDPEAEALVDDLLRGQASNLTRRPIHRRRPTEPAANPRGACAAPGRAGRHEWYSTGATATCRACGASTALLLAPDRLQ